jgi:hypothetical protein
MQNQLVPAMVLSRCIPSGAKELSATFMSITIKLANNPSINLLITLLDHLFIPAVTPVVQADWKAVKSDSLLDGSSGRTCRAGRRP